MTRSRPLATTLPVPTPSKIHIRRTTAPLCHSVSLSHTVTLPLRSIVAETASMGSSTPPPATPTWRSQYPDPRARRAGPARCARPDGRARAGRPRQTLMVTDHTKLTGASYASGPSRKTKATAEPVADSRSAATGCPLRARCTTTADGRSMTIHPHADLLRAARTQAHTPQFKHLDSGLIGQRAPPAPLPAPEPGW